MTAIEDFSKRFPGQVGPFGGIGRGSMYGQSSSTNQSTKPSTGPQYRNPNTLMSQAHHSNVTTLTEGLNRLNMQNPSYAPPAKPASQMSARTSEFNGVSLTPNLPHIPQAFVYNGQIMLAGQGFPTASAAHTMLPQSPGVYATVGPQLVNQGAFHGYNHLNSPIGQNWNSSRQSSAEMPSLLTPRRDSNSSNEVEGPGTPFTAYTPQLAYGEFHPSVHVIDRSPHGSLNWSTPSPTGTGYGFGKASSPISIDPRLQILVQQEPSIPRAVPAPYSPMKPLDRSLENPNGVTNVYIRGLHPETTDEVLYTMSARFGDIVSSKSIIDHATGLCKGFGFVKYHNFKDAEDCIRGFHMQGYETSFARESFYSQLKKLQDELNTNLYVSNLPKDMNEHELGAIFAPHKVCSSRILRDTQGHGRGVGFARFESRTICEEVIKNFNNVPISSSDGEDHLIQIRFADTQEQKALKQQTTAARQYRTAEYESQTKGTPGFPPMLRNNGLNMMAPLAEVDFETYMSAANCRPGIPFASQPNYNRFGPRGIVNGQAQNTAQSTDNVDHVYAPTSIKAEPSSVKRDEEDENDDHHEGVSLVT